MMTPSEIITRLGCDVVLIPIKEGMKASAVNNWSKLDFGRTQASTYQQRLAKASAIAVCLGSQSEGVCSIDFDDESAMTAFLGLNPNLKESLTTKGKRGCNIWLQVSGEYPRTKKLKRGDCPIGEWRSSGGYTIITGLHKEGIEYKVLVNAPPVSIAFQEIFWPAEWTKPDSVSFSPSPYLSEISDISVVSTVSIYQPPLSLIERDLQARKARKELAKNKNLSLLYDRYIKRKFKPRQGSRNDTLIAMVTFLYYSVGGKRLTELVTAYHQTNYDVFLDPVSQHIKEATSHIRSLEIDFLSKLSPPDLAQFQELPSQHGEAFRIFRDLAHADHDGFPDGRFFISFSELANRLATSASQAGRIIEALISLKILKVIKKGNRHKKGSKSLATIYRWLLS